jgi:hypothetical protein
MFTDPEDAYRVSEQYAKEQSEKAVNIDTTVKEVEADETQTNDTDSE